MLLALSAASALAGSVALAPAATASTLRSASPSGPSAASGPASTNNDFGNPTVTSIQGVSNGHHNATPDSASGCNYLVCISDVGGGLYVDSVYIHTRNYECIPATGFTFVDLHIGPGTREPISEQFRIPRDGYCYYGAYFFFTSVPWPNGYYFCGTISDFPGEPCFRIKA